MEKKNKNKPATRCIENSSLMTGLLRPGSSKEFSRQRINKKGHQIIKKSKTPSYACQS